MPEEKDPGQIEDRELESLEKELESPEKEESQTPSDVESPEKKEKESPEKQEQEKEEEEEILEAEEYEKRFLENHPDLVKLNINSLEDLVNAYKGGKDNFQVAREALSDLEKEIPELKTKEGREAFLSNFRQGGIKAVIPKAPVEQFKEERKAQILKMIPPKTQDKTTDPVTGEETFTERELNEEEKAVEIEKMENFCDTIFPPKYIQSIAENSIATGELLNEFAWREFKMKNFLDKVSQMEEFKDMLIPDDVRNQIKEYFKDDPELRKKIVNQALNAGKNHFEELHRHMVSLTKADEIRSELEKKMQEKKDQKEKKEKEKLGEIPGKKTPVSKKVKFEDLPLSTMEEKIEKGIE